MRYKHAALALAGSAAAWAMAAPAAAQPVAGADTACCRVPARTPVEIEILGPISTRTDRTGASFAIRLAAPLVVDGRTLAPAGAEGVGEIVHSARAGMAGRAGELILAARYLEVDGRRLRLRSLRFAQQGRDGSGAVAIGSSVAGALVPMVSMIGFLIQGGEVQVPAGTRAQALTAEEAILPPVAEAQ